MLICWAPENEGENLYLIWHVTIHDWMDFLNFFTYNIIWFVVEFLLPRGGNDPTTNIGSLKEFEGENSIIF